MQYLVYYEHTLSMKTLKTQSLNKTKIIYGSHIWKSIDFFAKP